LGEELEMTSHRKSFTVALSRDMVPTARVVVYYVSGQPEEIVVDSLTFFVDGTDNNKVRSAVLLLLYDKVLFTSCVLLHVYVF
jgi:hypothetical protein